MSDPVLRSSEITDESAYLNRRVWLGNTLKFAAAAGSVAATGALYRTFTRQTNMALKTDPIANYVAATTQPVSKGFNLTEAITPVESAINYNNFYEFTTNKQSVAAAAVNFKPRPWQVVVDGLVHRPGPIDIEDLLKISPLEERIYRMRCVEAWSMVIPWIGLPLGNLLRHVEPLGKAKFVAFETLVDHDQFPGQQMEVLDWPYVEGLRLDEALHPLTILAVGMYGQMLPGQNGAPLRLIVPWKYGFKGIKSIVKITLTDQQPPTTWNKANAGEYGFFANVNPAVPHPRWSQATEQRIGESGRRETLLFNGYADQVAALYRDMDLTVNF